MNFFSLLTGPVFDFVKSIIGPLSAFIGGYAIAKEGDKAAASEAIVEKTGVASGVAIDVAGASDDDLKARAQEWIRK